ncbi:UNVERIFIED_CONTAM: hypothetical protein RMT77_000858 [Armadillidium vulgare]
MAMSPPFLSSNSEGLLSSSASSTVLITQDLQTNSLVDFDPLKPPSPSTTIMIAKVKQEPHSPPQYGTEIHSSCPLSFMEDIERNSSCSPKSNKGKF